MPGAGSHIGVRAIGLLALRAAARWLRRIVTGTRVLVIGIDFDGTISAAPELFRLFITSAVSHGHTVVVVTSRRGGERDLAHMRSVMPDLPAVVFAAGDWKRWAAVRAGYRVDVWIDDLPEYIGPQAPAGVHERFVECACGAFTPERGRFCMQCGARTRRGAGGFGRGHVGHR